VTRARRYGRLANHRSGPAATAGWITGLARPLRQARKSQVWPGRYGRLANHRSGPPAIAGGS